MQNIKTQDVATSANAANQNSSKAPKPNAPSPNKERNGSKVIKKTNQIARPLKEQKEGQSFTIERAAIKRKMPSRRVRGGVF